MKKDYTWFKFNVNDWTFGDIQISSENEQETKELKAIFVDLIAYYWKRECNVTLANAKQWLSKSYSNCQNLLDRLLDLCLILLEKDGNKIHIEFLDEQWNDLEIEEDRQAEISVKRAKAGSKGGLAKAKAKPKQNLANARHIEKNKNKNKNIYNIEQKTENFKLEIWKFKNIYPTEMLADFFEYWSETNKSKTSLRYELEKTWDLKKRLKRWAQNNKVFSKEYSDNKFKTYPGDEDKPKIYPGSFGKKEKIPLTNKADEINKLKK